jgi:hypothetical protein
MLVLDDPNGGAGLVDRAVAGAELSEPVLVLITQATEADLALEILGTLGKRTDVSGRPSTSWAAWRSVRIWLDALAIKRLTVANSEFLTPATVWLLSQLPDVLLIHDPKGATAVLNAVLEPFERPDPGCVTDRRPPRDRAGPPALPPPFPACPTDAFPFFLPACAELLTREQYSLVDDIYSVQHMAYALQTKAHEDDPYEHAAQIVRRLLEPVADPHRRLATARGIEHGFFEAGWLLRIDPARFIETTPSMAIAEIVTRVNWYVSCELAATAALASIGLDAGALSGLNADSLFLQSGGHYAIAQELQIGSTLQVPVELRPTLAAFWADHHETVPHPNNGPLFRAPDGTRLGARSIKRRLTRIALETGLPIASHWTPPADQRATKWMRHHGITLAEL